ncbi:MULTISPECIES: hypothetical protein [Caldilinea]|jgi:hypothetical protein|uniref:DUF4386 family protein n=1 Tax=Caldilinea aerophila (strain DSM 14535 / JCM 11387 / NBRC 104270 / STL-6-O1) TaxID=926550 RepID=I0I125_CALAS|nr:MULTISPECIES: hypothetical protein [Caldilinea]BAL98962.1 hypothetical protein CLDAP_09230 [Caldilinea aerophila DSM 14535 = NBRC 104270]GIV74450.1 MAG: hypothetical protein KatS3mg049_3006 [Caldilinea sp.]
MTTTSFDRTAGLAAMLAALVGLLYSVSFVILQNALLYSLCLMLGGLLSLVVLVALFERLGEVDTKVAMLGLMLGAVAALGATIHGGYDLANVLNPPGALPDGVASLPSQIDPRGLLTFGVAGLAVLLAGLLMRRHPAFSRGFTALTFVLGALLIGVYVGRLIVLTPSSPLVLLPAALTGFVVNPLWYVLLGLSLRRGDMAVAEANAPAAA